MMVLPSAPAGGGSSQQRTTLQSLCVLCLLLHPECSVSPPRTLLPALCARMLLCTVLLASLATHHHLTSALLLPGAGRQDVWLIDSCCSSVAGGDRWCGVVP